MQGLEVSGAVRPIYGSPKPIYGSLGVKTLSKCKIAVVIVNLLEIFHNVFLCRLFLLAYFMCVGAYVFSSSS